MVKSRYTPAGIFTLVSKTSPKTLRGPKQADGSYEWESDVTFWMPFNGGIGLHDATWRSSFGGNIYKNSGSHGCVNLPYNVAKTIYNNIEVGTPIIVYYSDDYSVRDDSAERAAQNLPETSTVTDPTSTPTPTTPSAPTQEPTSTPNRPRSRRRRRNRPRSRRQRRRRPRSRRRRRNRPRSQRQRRRQRRRPHLLKQRSRKRKLCRRLRKAEEIPEKNLRKVTVQPAERQQKIHCRILPAETHQTESDR